MTRAIGIICEDEGHFRAGTRLIDDVLLAEVEWLDGVLEVSRSWCGRAPGQLWYKYQAADAADLRDVVVEGRRLRVPPRVNGDLWKDEGRMWWRALQLFVHREQRPDAMVLIRDQDGRKDRDAAMQQAVRGFAWPFPIACALPVPEVEAWHVAGFVPRDDSEAGRLKEVCAALGFDPTQHSERLTSGSRTQKRDAKRTLDHLCVSNADREIACLADRELLRRNGRDNGLAPFLDEVAARLVPLFKPRRGPL